MEGKKAREGKNDEVRLEHQTINSPLSLWVEGFGGAGVCGKADFRSGGVGGGGTMSLFKARRPRGRRQPRCRDE